MKERAMEIFVLFLIGIAVVIVAIVYRRGIPRRRSRS